MIKANDKNIKSWIVVPENSDFPIQNIPFGIAKVTNNVFVATRIGDTIINLYQCAKLGYLTIDAEVFNNCVLNDFMRLGKQVTRTIRNEISALFNETNDSAKHYIELKNAVSGIDEVEMLLQIQIGD